MDYFREHCLLFPAEASPTRQRTNCRSGFSREARASVIYKPVALWVISETILHYSRLKPVLHGGALFVGVALVAKRVACDIYRPIALWVISEGIFHYSRLKPVLQ